MNKLAICLLFLGTEIIKFFFLLAVPMSMGGVSTKVAPILVPS
jgi:hypothetical protein